VKKSKKNEKGGSCFFAVNDKKKRGRKTGKVQKGDQRYFKEGYDREGKA